MAAQHVDCIFARAAHDLILIWFSLWSLASMVPLARDALGGMTEPLLKVASSMLKDSLISNTINELPMISNLLTCNGVLFYLF